jgi:hypothetical protein
MVWFARVSRFSLSPISCLLSKTRLGLLEPLPHTVRFEYHYGKSGVTSQIRFIDHRTVLFIGITNMTANNLILVMSCAIIAMPINTSPQYNLLAVSK